MAKVYVTKCIVKRNDKQYQRGAVIEGLSAEEIERGLAEHWLEAVGADEGPTNVEDHKNKKGGKKDDKDNKPPAKTEKDQLLEKAVDLGILDKITDEMTVEEIQKLITEAQAK